MLHANRNASVVRRVMQFAFLSNSLQNHMTLALLVMVGPGKLMVGHRPCPGLAMPLFYILSTTIKYVLAVANSFINMTCLHTQITDIIQNICKLLVI